MHKYAEHDHWGSTDEGIGAPQYAGYVLKEMSYRGVIEGDTQHAGKKTVDHASQESCECYVGQQAVAVGH
jgi:hypothetical protein